MTIICNVMEAIGAFAMGLAIFSAVHWFVYTVAALVRRRKS